MVVYGHSVFSSTPKHEQKGRMPFILASWAILVTCTINVVLSAYDIYLQLYLGGPTGKSYIVQFVTNSANDATATGVAGDVFLWITVAAGDILMVSVAFSLEAHN